MTPLLQQRRYTEAEVAAKLDVSPQTLWRWRKERTDG